MVYYLAPFCVRFGVIYLIAPPLLVFFTEVTSARDAKSVKTPVSTVLFLTLCALAGSEHKAAPFCIRFALPVTCLAALAAAILSR